MQETYTAGHYLTKQMIRCRQKAQDWKEAAIQASELLMEKHISREYQERMLEKMETDRAYMVLAPGVAVIHARPGKDVMEDGISLITLEAPVKFGNAGYDPVQAVFMLAANTDNSHIQLMMAVAQKLSQPQVREKMMQAQTEDELWNLMQD